MIGTSIFDCRRWRL